MPDNYRQKPKGAPQEAVHNSGELRAYHGVPRRGPVSDEMAQNLIRGYYACVSYTDALVGKLLDELDRLKLTDNTIIVLWGDHGWNLGDHTMWCKHSCFETSLQVPLLVVAPGYKAGQRSSKLVESIDIYPTLCDLTGLAKPGHLQGQSLVALLKNPEDKWKPFAISRYRNGDSVRTDHFRYTKYSRPNGRTHLAKCFTITRTTLSKTPTLPTNPTKLAYWPNCYRLTWANLARRNRSQNNPQIEP